MASVRLFAQRRKLIINKAWTLSDYRVYFPIGGSAERYSPMKRKLKHGLNICFISIKTVEKPKAMSRQ